VGEDKD
jgi:hypothetical protein